VRLAVTHDGWRHVAGSTRPSPELGLRPEVDTQERQDLSDCLAGCLVVV
jgi:hypothetical protein